MPFQDTQKYWETALTRAEEVGITFDHPDPISQNRQPRPLSKGELLETFPDKTGPSRTKLRSVALYLSENPGRKLCYDVIRDECEAAKNMPRATLRSIIRQISNAQTDLFKIKREKKGSEAFFIFQPSEKLHESDLERSQHQTRLSIGDTFADDDIEKVLPGERLKAARLILKTLKEYQDFAFSVGEIATVTGLKDHVIRRALKNKTVKLYLKEGRRSIPKKDLKKGGPKKVKTFQYKGRSEVKSQSTTEAQEPIIGPQLNKVPEADLMIARSGVMRNSLRYLSLYPKRVVSRKTLIEDVGLSANKSTNKTLNKLTRLDTEDFQVIRIQTSEDVYYCFIPGPPTGVEEEYPEYIKTQIHYLEVESKQVQITNIPAEGFSEETALQLVPEATNGRTSRENARKVLIFLSQHPEKVFDAKMVKEQTGVEVDEREIIYIVRVILQNMHTRSCGVRYVQYGRNIFFTLTTDSNKTTILDPEQDIEFIEQIEDIREARRNQRLKDKETAPHPKTKSKNLAKKKKSRTSNESYSSADKRTLETYLKYISKQKTPSKEEQTELAIRIHEHGDASAREEMYRRNLRLVVWVARQNRWRIQGTTMTFLDLIQEGSIGLAKAIEKFEYQRGYKFSTYAVWWIRQAVQRAIEEQGRTIRIPIHAHEEHRQIQQTRKRMRIALGRKPKAEEVAKEVGIKVEKIKRLDKAFLNPTSTDKPIGEDGDAKVIDFIECQKSGSGFEEVERVDQDTKIRAAIEKSKILTEQEKIVIKMRFGIGDIHGVEHKQSEIGAALGVSRARAQAVEASALKKLRECPEILSLLAA